MLEKVFLLFSVIPLLLFVFIWNASIGTVLFLITAVFLSIYFNQFEIAGIFTLLSLIPIFVKRLSPIRELSLKKRRDY